MYPVLLGNKRNKIGESQSKISPLNKVMRISEALCCINKSLAVVNAYECFCKMFKHAFVDKFFNLLCTTMTYFSVSYLGPINKY